MSHSMVGSSRGSSTPKKNRVGDSITKYHIYHGGIGIGFEMFRKYAQHVDASSSKWDKIQVFEAIAILEKRGP
ncbi:unnamed protein product [Prunus armeniaca]